MWQPIISISALVVSAVALSWSVISHRLTGRRAAVTMASRRSTFFVGTTVLTFTVTATGRLPIEVSGWTLDFPDALHTNATLARNAHGITVYNGAPIPKIIQPGTTATFAFPTNAIEAAQNHVDVGRALLAVYFTARKPLRARFDLSERLSAAPDGPTDPGERKKRQAALQRSKDRDQPATSSGSDTSGISEPDRRR